MIKELKDVAGSPSLPGDIWLYSSGWMLSGSGKTGVK
jgi:hypothetical protein